MTDIPDIRDLTAMAPGAVDPAPRHTASYRLEEAYWGYRIVPLAAPPVALILLQTLALLAGAACLAAAFALWHAAPPGGLAFRVPAIFVGCGLGAVLMHVATHSPLIQIEVDTQSGELREIQRSRTGAVTLVASHGFDGIAAVDLLQPPAGPASVTLRLHGSAQPVLLGQGPAADLDHLRQRLQRDILLPDRAARR